MGFLSGIGSAITSGFKSVTSIVSNVAKAVTTVATPILNQAKDIFSAVSQGAGFVGQLANLKLPFGLPNPLQALAPLAKGIQGGAAGISDVLKNMGSQLNNATVDGKPVTLPSLGDRAGTVAKQAQAISAGVAAGTVAPTAAASGSGAATGASTVSAGAYDTGMTKFQQENLDKAEPGAERDRMAAQFKMQNHMELMAFISNMQKMIHDTAMSIIGNIR